MANESLANIFISRCGYNALLSALRSAAEGLLNPSLEVGEALSKGFEIRWTTNEANCAGMTRISTCILVFALTTLTNKLVHQVCILLPLPMNSILVSSFAFSSTIISKHLQKYTLFMIFFSFSTQSTIQLFGCAHNSILQTY